MNFYIVLILAIIFTENKARQIQLKDALPQDEVHKSAAQLAKLIHLVSGYTDVGSGTFENEEELNEEDEERTKEDGRAETSLDLQPFDLDYFSFRKYKPHVRIKTMGTQGKHQAYQSPRARPNLAYEGLGVMPHQAYHSLGVRPHQANQGSGIRLIQGYQSLGNQPNQAYHNQRVKLQQESPVSRPYHPYQSTEARLYRITNPRILEKYQKKIRQPVKLYQFSRDDDDTSTNSKQSMLDQRRNAVFRLDSSIEDAPKSTNNDDLKIKHDVHKILNGIKKRDENIYLDDKYHDVDVLLDDDNRKKGREDDSLKQDNAWDVITKKYEWNDKHSNQYDDAPRNKKESLKKINEAEFDDNWNKREKKEKNLKWVDSTDRKPKIKKDFDNSYEKPRKENQNIDWDVTAFKLSIPKTTKRWKQEINNDWNKKVIKPDLDDWGQKITKPDTFNDWPKKQRKEKKPKWDNTDIKPKIKKDFDNSYEKPRNVKQNTDRDVTVFKLSNLKTTKKWKQDKNGGWDKAYAPKISSYNHPRNKKSRASYDSGGFFGRTPIPYVGRQGIYVDN